MPGMQFKHFSITTKFILWFLVIALAPLIIATYISYNSSRSVVRQEILNSLIAVTEKKTNQIEAYLENKKEDLTSFSHTSDIIVAMEKYDKAFDAGGFEAEAYVAADGEYRPFLTYFQKTYGYDDLFLIRSFGDIIFSINKRAPTSVYNASDERYTQLASVFAEVIKSNKTEVSDFEYNSDANEGHVFIASPIFKAGDVVGVIAAQMSNKGVSELVKDYAGLGKTGETVIIAKIGNDAVYVTPLRFDEKAAFQKKIALGAQQGSELQRAVKGQNGSGAFIDYRGREVLSVWRHLPSFRWGIAVKMDTDEIFSSANKLRNTLFTVSAMLLFLVIVIASIAAGSISRPIKALTEISGTITSGDLKARADVKSNDEIGVLAKSFNQMTDSLVEAKAVVEQKNEELGEQKKLLEKANQELDSFVYTASHDLRAPLRGISSFASFLEEDYKDKLDDQGKGYLKEIREATNRMNRLIEDLLTLSRISRIKNPFEDVNINELIDSVIKRLEFDIKEKNVDMHIQSNIPMVHCDRIKMTEVFYNLINNGIKFSSKNNKENPKIEVGYIDNKEFHEFYVKDNGIGIAPQYQEQVFGMFKRLHTQEEYEGTGAGLGIVKRVIDDHGGRIWIDSDVGKGAVFYFTIPKIFKKKKKIGEILVEDGVVSQAQLDEKLRKQQGV